MEGIYGTLLKALAFIAALLLGSTAFAVTLDVVARNLGLGTLSWILEVSEYILPLATFLVAPWLLYRNEHIRLDVLLGAWPWLRHVVHVVGLTVSAVLVVYGVRTILNSLAQGSMVFKSVVFPEWWLYVPVPLCFGLLAAEFLRRLCARR